MLTRNRADNNQKKPKKRIYKDRTGVRYEIASGGGGKIIPTQGDPLQVYIIGYFSHKTIRELAERFTKKTGKNPTLTEIAGDLFMSPKLGHELGGRVVYLDGKTRRYFKSHTITDVRVI